MLGCLEFSLVHIFREANAVADSLASHAVLRRNSVDFSIELKLPGMKECA